MEKHVIYELIKFNVNTNEISNFIEISNSEGIEVYSFEYQNRYYILKYIFNNDFKREIDYYNLLNEIGIETVKIYNFSINSILMENINYNGSYRLASYDDLSNPQIVSALAKWYKELHIKGKNYLNVTDVNLYSEIELLNENSLNLIRENSNYKHEKFWSELESTIKIIKQYCKYNKTITYNDFSYDNMVVSRDHSKVLMLDFNLLGEGLPYFDVRNVTNYFSEEMKVLFFETYGEINSFEKDMDEIVSPLIALTIAYKKDEFPEWANKSKYLIDSGELYSKLKNYLKNYK